MPTISMFYGILIRMFFTEHSPPHFHAVYQGDKAMFDINTGEKIAGNLPKDKQRLVEAWWVLHKDELLANWDLARNNETFFKIEGLK